MPNELAISYNHIYASLYSKLSTLQLKSSRSENNLKINLQPASSQILQANFELLKAKSEHSLKNNSQPASSQIQQANSELLKAKSELSLKNKSQPASSYILANFELLKAKSELSLKTNHNLHHPKFYKLTLNFLKPNPNLA